MSNAASNPLIPDIVVVKGTAAIDASAGECWLQIGGFADAGKFLAVESKIIAGDGGIGSVRLIGGAIIEVMVGHSETSYTYAQTDGPMARFQYHGSVLLTPTSPTSCHLTYSISWDQAPMDAAQRDTERVRIAKRFQGAADEMKRVAEAAALGG